jgi:hypothetical protein
MHRVVAVTALPGNRISVRFDDGISGEVDLSERLFGPVFQPLAEDPSLFARVFVDEFGAVCWPNGADLAPDAIYRELTRTTTTATK